MTKIKQGNMVKEIAAEIGMPYERFLYRCILKGISVDTVKAVWDKEDRERGFFKSTQRIVADVLKRPVEDVFPNE